MKYYMGCGITGLDEIFGSYASTILFIPEVAIERITEEFKDSFKKELTDMDSIYIVKKLLKNYDGDFIKFFDESHYMFPVGIKAGDTGTLSILTTNPEYICSESDVLIITEKPNIEYFNDIHAGFYASVMISETVMVEKMAKEILDDITKGEYKIITSVLDEEGADDKLYAANVLANAISNVSFLSQISNLSLACKVNIPRKFSKKTMDFYLRRCENMPIEQKKHLLKLHYVNEILDNQ